MKKLFGGINLSWPKVIIMAILAGVYTAVMAIIPIAKDTSFADITVTFEVWILFGIFIIMNSKSNMDSALKCFIFFLISQPLVYLIQVPFTVLGWQIFIYYKYWFIWTILTIPMGFIGYFIKKDKWWGLIILTPILLLLGMSYVRYLGLTLYMFPYHVLTTAFCILSLIIYPLVLFNNKKIKIVGLIISLIIIASISIFTIKNQTTYNTTLLTSGGKLEITFDDTYKVYLSDESFGKVYIVYEDAIEEYMVNAEFKKAGNTELILESPDGEILKFDVTVKDNTYDIVKK